MSVTSSLLSIRLPIVPMSFLSPVTLLPSSISDIGSAVFLLFPFLLTLQHLSVVVLCVSRLPAPVFVPPFPVASAGSMTSPAGSTSSTSAGDFYKAAASSLGAAYARPTTTASAEEKLSRRQVSFCTNCFLSVVC